MAEKKTTKTPTKKVIAEKDEKHALNNSKELIDTKLYQVVGLGKNGIEKGKEIKVSGVVAKALLNKGLVKLI
jgi:hypothetical protein